MRESNSRIRGLTLLALSPFFSDGGSCSHQVLSTLLGPSELLGEQLLAERFLCHRGNLLR